MVWEMHQGKSPATFIFGALVFLLGLVPLLKNAGVIGFSLPALPQLALVIILAAAGAYLIIDGVIEISMNSTIGGFSIVTGFLVGGLGFVATLNALGVLSLPLAFITPLVIQIAYLIVGALLAFAAFTF